MKYFRKDIIKVQVDGSLYIHRLLHGKMKIKITQHDFAVLAGMLTRDSKPNVTEDLNN